MIIRIKCFVLAFNALIKAVIEDKFTKTKKKLKII